MILTFDLKINRAHPWLMGSKCMKVDYYISKGIWLAVRKPIVDACPPNAHQIKSRVLQLGKTLDAPEFHSRGIKQCEESNLKIYGTSILWDKAMAWFMIYDLG